MIDNGVKEKVLGMQWHIKESITLALTFVSTKKTFHKTRVTFQTACVYDPLRFVASVILEAKLLIQDLCKQKPNWDSVISKEVRVSGLAGSRNCLI